MPLALALIALSVAWRIAALSVPALANFAPLMALTFCGAVYFRDKRLWLVPFAALTLSDLYIDHHYATTLRYEWSVGGAVFFYLVTNTASWLGDVAYLPNAAGWWQAMTVGHPAFPPTLWFFRNTLVSDLGFTGAFALTMEFAALRAGRASLLTRRATA